MSQGKLGPALDGVDDRRTAKSIANSVVFTGTALRALDSELAARATSGDANGASGVSGSHRGEPRSHDVVLAGRRALDTLDAGYSQLAVAAPPAAENARTSPEYAAVGDQLPFLAGRSREEIEALLKTHGLVNVASDPLEDLVAAQERLMVEEGREPVRRRRYVVWGDLAR